MQCQDQKRQLLESRIKNLDIKSPEAGIVVSGDLERTEGPRSRRARPCTKSPRWIA